MNTNPSGLRMQAKSTGTHSRLKVSSALISTSRANSSAVPMFTLRKGSTSSLTCSYASTGSSTQAAPFLGPACLDAVCISYFALCMLVHKYVWTVGHANKHAFLLTQPREGSTLPLTHGCKLMTFWVPFIAKPFPRVRRALIGHTTRGTSFSASPSRQSRGSRSCQCRPGPGCCTAYC